MIITVLSQATIIERLEATNDEGLYKIGLGRQWQRLHCDCFFPMNYGLLKTQQLVEKGQICKPDSAFVQYAHTIYQSKKKQIIFALLEGSVATMAEARNCMLKIMPNKILNIGWIIANNELLKSVSLDDIPPYIERVIK